LCTKSTGASSSKDLSPSQSASPTEFCALSLLFFSERREKKKSSFSHLFTIKPHRDHGGDKEEVLALRQSVAAAQASEREAADRLARFHAQQRQDD
jgi:hypothetical protein